MTRTRRRAFTLGPAFAIATAIAGGRATNAHAQPAPPAVVSQPPPPGTPSPAPSPPTSLASGTAATGAGATGATGAAAAAADADAAQEVRRTKSIVEFDVQPTVRVLKTDEVEIRAGGLVQMQVVPYVGEDALVSNNDPASNEGFRLRRAGFGLQGRLRERIGTLLAVNAIQAGSDVDRAISNALLFWEAAPELLLSVGTVKVPFSRAALESSRTFVGIERPLAVNVITPSRRLGVTAEGHLFGNRVVYLAGVMNGTEGFALGNQFGGALGGARVETYPWAESPDPYEHKDGIAVAADAVYGDSPSVRVTAYSADVYAVLRGAHLKLEAMCDQQTPKEAPIISPTLPDTLRRCGAYAEIGYVLPWLRTLPIQPMSRVEILDDNRGIADAGDVVIYDGGVNARIIGNYVRAQLHYIGRYELRGPSRSNDAVVLALQGTF